MKKILAFLIFLLLGGAAFFCMQRVNPEEYLDYHMRLSMGSQDFGSIIPKGINQDYLSYTDLREGMETAEDLEEYLDTCENKFIRIDSAEELYRFSVDVCYQEDIVYQIGDEKLSEELIAYLLDRHYVLGKDIDYSVMKSKQFIPIGYSFFSLDKTPHRKVFTGTFDGRGFEISNLYVAGYDNLITVEGSEGSEIDVAVTPYYAMFTYNEGTICNLGLINPTFELMQEHESITSAANLVGCNENTGTIHHVYVIDNRPNIGNAGIRMKAPTGQSSTSYSAAGVVYDNYGIFTDAYYVSKVVVNPAFINNFEVQPVLFEDFGTSHNLIYDNEVYQEEIVFGGYSYTVTTPNSLAAGEDTDTLCSEDSDLGSSWYYYEDDRYPSVLGLQRSGNKYLIYDAIDFITFSKLLSMITVKHDVAFRSSDYQLAGDIDFSEVAADAYPTPNIEFSGDLVGEGHYLSNLHLVNGVIIDNNYYSGLFSVLSGTVSNLVLSNCTLTLNDTDLYYSNNFHIGMIAGKLDGGEITDVMVNATINLGTKTIGEFSVGTLVGTASGTLNNVYTEGILNANSGHEFDEEFDVNPYYNIGGMIGSTSTAELIVFNALNRVEITGIGSTANITTTAQSVTINIGGIIGRVVNTASGRHTLGLLTNEAEIIASNYHSEKDVNQNIGGVIGLSAGLNYQFTSQHGEWTNEGLINVRSAGSNKITAAGIVVCQHTETAEFIYLYNKSTYDAVSFTTFKYTSLVYDLGSTGVIISQSLNEADYALPVNYSFSGVYHSATNAPTTLRFVENKGTISYTTEVTQDAEVKIAGISISENINYQSCFFSGLIEVYDLELSASLWISGITHTLSAQKYLKDCINKGQIVAAAITTTKNIYLAGLVNVNYAGTLHTSPQDGTGIRNSINYADIISNHTEGYGISGVGNTFAGGIVTLNRGSIQDSINMGDIKLVNITQYASANVKFKSDDDGGYVENYSCAILAGGVAAAAAHGNSRIYDCVNSGDIIGLSEHFVRTGGVLAHALYLELNLGGVSGTYIDNSIQDSILSNCLNYGFVSAITKTIVLYSTSQTGPHSFGWESSDSGTNVYPRNFYTTAGTAQRPGIYASAGGVIGYGLSKMYRMVNHGVVSSTDVAGGLVGATVVITNTTVYIETAINYGSVRAVDYTDYDDIHKDDISAEDIEQYFLNVNDPFIFPTIIPDSTRLQDIRLYPESKRGIGGIFGRLQRARSQEMTAENGVFDYIVNMDPNVDLIGRLDQVTSFHSSGRYFIFPDCKYYSARYQDTTQAVFTGFAYFYRSSSGSITTYTSRIEVTSKNRYHYVVDQNGDWKRYTEKYIETRDKIDYRGTLRHRIGGADTESYSNTTYTYQYKLYAERWEVISGSVVDLNDEDYADYTDSFYSDPFWIQPTTVTLSGPTQGTTRTGTYFICSALPVDNIKEDPNGLFGEFIYDPGFEMRTEPDLQEYIYYVENGILSDRFRDDRPHGMYVLSTTLGSTYGSALPSNVDLTKTYPLAGQLPYNTNYDNIPLSQRQEPETGLEQQIYTDYQTLLQTRYNDKSALLGTDQTFWLQETNGSGVNLLNPSFNGFNITFDLRLDLFDEEQTEAFFRIADVAIPAKALIAEDIDDYSGSQATFLTKLYQDRDDVISDQLPPLLYIPLDNYQNISSMTQVFIGNFVSYSEAAVHNTAFLNANYTTEYQVYVNLYPRTDGSSPAPYQYSRDDGTLSNFPSSGTITAAIISKLRVTFRDVNSVLPIGSDIAPFIKLYYEDHPDPVLPEYYQLQTVKVADSTYHPFEFTITLSSSLRGGDYQIRYRYFSIDDEKTINFTKASSSANDITLIGHYSYGSFDPSGTTFTSYVNFGFNLLLDDIDIDIGTNPQITLPYLDNQVIDIRLAEQEEFKFYTNFKVSPFATLESVNVLTPSYSDGYIIYHLSYVVSAENGSEKTYYHDIYEREIDFVNVYKNNNRVSIDNIFCTREDMRTKFAIDFGLDPNYDEDIYKLNDGTATAYFVINVQGFDPDGNPYASVTGIEYDVDNYLNINIYYEAEPGTYDFTITYHRGSQVVSFDHILQITKKEGVSAYLKDMKFSPSGVDTDYGLIYVSDEDGNIISSQYMPRFYFDGIDYDGAMGAIFDFRVFGEVANTPLDEYAPYLLEHLPAGATIARKIYPLEDPHRQWTDEIDNDSTPAEKAQLQANFTIMPQTGNEPNEDLNEYVVITYRVTSENGDNEVFYHITVIDVVYNVTIIFDVFFDGPGGLIDIANSELAGLPILINVMNFTTDIAPSPTPINDVNNFPVFTTKTGENNNVGMFLVGNNQNYRYRFGRNMSGFYAFSVKLPKDPNGNDYAYTITFNNQELKSLSSYGIDGRYFYINYGTRNRTRRFNLIISRTDTNSDNSWGLIDYLWAWITGSQQ